MRRTNAVTCWLILIVAFTASHQCAAQQLRSRFITRQSVDRLFNGRSRLLTSRRGATSLFSVTDFYDSGPKPQTAAQTPSGSSWEPIEPELPPLVVPAPMTFTEDFVFIPAPTLAAKMPGNTALPGPKAAIPQLAKMPALVATSPAVIFEDPFADPQVTNVSGTQTPAASQVVPAEQVAVEPVAPAELPTVAIQTAPQPAEVIAVPEATTAPVVEVDSPTPARTRIAAPPVPLEPIAFPLTESGIRKHVANLEAHSHGNSSDRLTAVVAYNRAISWLQASKDASQQVEQIQSQFSALPGQLAEAKAAVKQLRAASKVQPSMAGISLRQLQADNAKLKWAVADLKMKRESLSVSVQEAQQKPVPASPSKAELKAAINQAERFTTIDTGLKGQAATIEASARTTMLRNQLELVTVRETTDANLAKLNKLKLAAFGLQLDSAGAQLKAIQQAIDNAREQSAAEAAARAKERDEQMPAKLKSYEDENTVVAGRLEWLQTKLAETRTYSAEAEAIRTRLTKSFDRIRKIQDRTGLDATLGTILSHELAHLPSTREWQRQVNGIKGSLHELSEVEFDIENKRSESEQFQATLTQTVTELIAANRDRREIIQGMGNGIAKTHQVLIADSVTAAQEYSEELTTFHDKCNQLIKQIEAFESHINKNVLWIRSNDPLGIGDVAAFPSLAISLGSYQPWLSAASSVVEAISDHLALLALMALFVLVVMVFGDELRARLKRSGERACSNGRIRLWPTWEAIAVTCLLALPWPAFLWTLGWCISRSLVSTPLALACAYALQTSALWLGAFTLPRSICLPEGLGQRHLGWNESALKSMYFGLPKVMNWGVPVVAIVAFLSEYDEGAWSGNVGRIVFIAGVLVLAYYVRRALHTVSGFIVKCTRSTSLLYRLRQPIAVASFVVILTLAATSAAGYHHSALQLTRCLQETWMMAIGLAVVFGLLIRSLDWVLQSFETGRPFAKVRLKAKAFDPDGEEAEAVTAQKELATAREQVQRFLRLATMVAGVLACWGIWHHVLPALNVVNDVQLWTMTRDVAVPADSQQGEALQTIKQVVPITLGDVIRGLIILVVTITAARNLPGLLDTLLLRRLPLDRGGRHAVSTISRYVLITVGMLLTLKQIGIDWASLQWMVAAMTVGLGFGLQEIFANFVSGLIILLERPIRLGDFVTVNGETGFVTRIQFRATTITDLDRRELLVPNKKFITDELINWTLSDPITRIVLPIGIAYGSDTTLAHQLLVEVAETHPIVLKEPGPSAIMTSFGDSTLNFELRVFIPRRDEFAQITHELNTAIDRKFRTADIEIAFPQCDINVRGLEHLAGLRKKAA